VPPTGAGRFQNKNCALISDRSFGRLTTLTVWDDKSHIAGAPACSVTSDDTLAAWRLPRNAWFGRSGPSPAGAMPKGRARSDASPVRLPGSLATGCDMRAMTSGPLALLCPPLREQSQSNGARALSGLDSDAQSAGSSSRRHVDGIPSSWMAGFGGWSPRSTRPSAREVDANPVRLTVSTERTERSSASVRRHWFPAKRRVARAQTRASDQSSEPALRPGLRRRRVRAAQL
jgi:hypothetical protein